MLQRSLPPRQVRRLSNLLVKLVTLRPVVARSVTKQTLRHRLAPLPANFAAHLPTRSWERRHGRRPPWSRPLPTLDMPVKLRRALAKNKMLSRNVEKQSRLLLRWKTNIIQRSNIYHLLWHLMVRGAYSLTNTDLPYVFPKELEGLPRASDIADLLGKPQLGSVRVPPPVDVYITDKDLCLFSSNASANDQQVQVRGANKTKDKTEKRRTTAHLLQNIPRSATTSSQRHVTRVAGTSIQPKNADIHRLAPRPTNKVRNGEPRSTPHKSLHSRTTDKLGMIAEANVQYSIEGFAL